MASTSPRRLRELSTELPDQGSERRVGFRQACWKEGADVGVALDTLRDELKAQGFRWHEVRVVGISKRCEGFTKTGERCQALTTTTYCARHKTKEVW